MCVVVQLWQCQINHAACTYNTHTVNCANGLSVIGSSGFFFFLLLDDFVTVFVDFSYVRTRLVDFTLSKSCTHVRPSRCGTKASLSIIFSSHTAAHFPGLLLFCGTSQSNQVLPDPPREGGYSNHLQRGVCHKKCSGTCVCWRPLTDVISRERRGASKPNARVCCFGRAGARLVGGPSRGNGPVASARPRGKRTTKGGGPQSSLLLCYVTGEGRVC